MLDDGCGRSHFWSNGELVEFNRHDPESMKRYAAARMEAVEFLHKTALKKPEAEPNGTIDIEKARTRKGLIETTGELLRKFQNLLLTGK